MNSKSKPNRVPGTAESGATLKWVVLSTGVLVATTAGLNGQSVLVPLNPPPAQQSSTAFFQTNGVAGESILTASAPDPQGMHPFRWGPFVAHARIDYQYANISGLRQGTKAELQGTNLVYVPRDVSSILHVISPGVSVNLGKQWRLDAGVGLNYYTDPAMQDNASYTVGLNGSIPYEEWIFGVSAGYSMSESTLIETATQTKQDSYNTGVSAVYGSRRRMSLELSANQSLMFSEDYNDSMNWSTMNWLNYVLTPRTTAGFGLGGGYTMLDSGELSLSSTGTDSAYEQLQGRVVWRPVDKISVNISGGAQIQQFLLDDGSATEVNPIWSVSAGYTPVDGTSFYASGSRTVGSSITTDEYTETAIMSFGYSQRLLKHLTLSMGPSYSMIDYRSNLDPTADDASRSDDVWSFNVRLSTVIFKKVSVSTFYNYTDNSTTAENASIEDYYSFDTRQFGFQIGYFF